MSTTLMMSLLIDIASHRPLECYRQAKTADTSTSPAAAALDEASCGAAAASVVRGESPALNDGILPIPGWRHGSDAVHYYWALRNHWCPGGGVVDGDSLYADGCAVDAPGDDGFAAMTMLPPPAGGPSDDSHGDCEPPLAVLVDPCGGSFGRCAAGPSGRRQG